MRRRDRRRRRPRAGRGVHRRDASAATATHRWPIVALICTVGPFAAERQARAQREQAAGELHRQDDRAHRPRAAMDDRLDVLDAAARRLGGVATHEPARDERRGGRDEHRRDPARVRRPVRPREHGDAQPLGVFERDVERAADEPGESADGEAAGRECQQPGCALSIIVVAIAAVTTGARALACRVPLRHGESRRTRCASATSCDTTTAV